MNLFNDKIVDSSLRAGAAAEQFSAVLEHLQHARLTFLSNIEQAGLILGRYADCMTTSAPLPGNIARTNPEFFSRIPARRLASANLLLCKENATYETRHSDCSLPGCTCPCHSRPR